MSISDWLIEKTKTLTLCFGSLLKYICREREQILCVSYFNIPEHHHVRLSPYSFESHLSLLFFSLSVRLLNLIIVKNHDPLQQHVLDIILRTTIIYNSIILSTLSINAHDWYC